MNVACTGNLVTENSWLSLFDESCLVGYSISLHNKPPESCVLQSEIKQWVQQQFEQGAFDIEYSVEVEGEYEYQKRRYYEQMGWSVDSESEN